MCCHSSLYPLAPANVPKDEKDANNIQRLLNVLKQSDAEECSICLELLSDPIITRCAHLFDLQCLQQHLSRNPSCPLCRAQVSEGQLIHPPPPPLELEEDPSGSSDIAESGFKSSAKVDFLVENLLKIKTQDPTIKSLVFSQWTSFLDICQKAIIRAGFKCVRLDGKMPEPKRKLAIRSFQNDPEVTVFLISLKAGGVGLNLTAASRVYMVDLWYNAAAENQAIDRCHRLGQTRPVEVYRFAMENSIEEKVLELQRKKEQIVQGAFGLGDTTRGRQQEWMANLGAIFDVA